MGIICIQFFFVSSEILLRSCALYIPKLFVGMEPTPSTLNKQERRGYLKHKSSFSFSCSTSRDINSSSSSA